MQYNIHAIFWNYGSTQTGQNWSMKCMDIDKHDI